MASSQEHWYSLCWVSCPCSSWSTHWLGSSTNVSPLSQVQVSSQSHTLAQYLCCFDKSHLFHILVFNEPLLFVAVMKPSLPKLLISLSLTTTTIHSSKKEELVVAGEACIQAFDLFFFFFFLVNPWVFWWLCWLGNSLIFGWILSIVGCSFILSNISYGNLTGGVQLCCFRIGLIV